jgi:hypothetical protein
MIHPIERSLTSLVIGGVFEKFSRLKIVSAENDVAWIPFFLFRIDTYAARGIQSKKLPLKPSEYIKRQVYATFIDDPVFVICSIGIPPTISCGRLTIRMGRRLSRVRRTMSRAI